MQDVEEALRRLPQEVVDARNQRLKRGIDINMKHAELAPELQAVQTPLEAYLEDTLAQVKLEKAERQALGAGMPYERHLP